MDEEYYELYYHENNYPEMFLYSFDELGKAKDIVKIGCSDIVRVESGKPHPLFIVK